MWVQKINVLRVALVMVSTMTAASSMAAAMPVAHEPDRYANIPALPVARQEVEIRCQTPQDGALPCTARIKVTLLKPVPEAQRDGVKLKLAQQEYVLLPTVVSGDVLIFEAAFRVFAIQFTGAVRDLSSIEVRHPIFVERWMASLYPVDYEAPSLRSAPIELTLVLPEEVHVEDVWTRLSADDTEEGSTLYETFGSASAYVLVEQTGRFSTGGPIVGVACNLRRSAEGITGCPMAVVGWEVSFPDWALYQLKIESDFQRNVTIIPSAEATLYADANLSFGGGFQVGFPVDIYPKPRVGIRAQLSFFTWVFGLGMGVDYFPLQEDEGGDTFNAIFNSQFSF